MTDSLRAEGRHGAPGAPSPGRFPPTPFDVDIRAPSTTWPPAIPSTATPGDIADPSAAPAPIKLGKVQELPQ